MLSINEYVDLLTNGQSLDASISSVAPTAAIEDSPSLLKSVEDERKLQQQEVMARIYSLEDKIDRIEQLIHDKLAAEKSLRPLRKAKKREKWQHETRNGKPVCPRCTRTLGNFGAAIQHLT
ncbi:MAG: hypothetical protein MHMPM18_004396 [Marteilia pararefringens]